MLNDGASFMQIYTPLWLMECKSAFFIGASALWVGKMRTKKESHVLISNTDTFLAEQSI